MYPNHRRSASTPARQPSPPVGKNPWKSVAYGDDEFSERGAQSCRSARSGCAWLRAEVKLRAPLLETSTSPRRIANRQSAGGWYGPFLFLVKDSASSDAIRNRKNDGPAWYAFLPRSRGNNTQIGFLVSVPRAHKILFVRDEQCRTGERLNSVG